ncbi:MAG: hypothetical protein N3D15_02750 [Syntrophorhabdaceae bacterium]|nr:hypothetical protein [Syntrophorhabdaceae bacterium]
MYVGEHVKVLATFDPGYKIRPVKFRWSGRTIRVTEITYTWRSKEGRKDIYHFALTDGSALYELTYDAESLLWRLENLEAGE